MRLSCPDCEELLPPFYLQEKEAVKIVIADDDRVPRFLLEATLKSWDYEVIVAEEGRTALAALQNANAPTLAILDWMMPHMDGLEVTRRLRKQSSSAQHYIILLTSKSEKQDIINALEAGADDYLTKPFDSGELRARVNVGVRMVELQRNLAARVLEVEEALANIKQLQGMLPICSYCKRIRDDQNYWETVEEYICAHSEASFSHGVCPDCYSSVVEPQLVEMKNRLAVTR